MKYLAVGMINLYQKYISPYKGFSCAYRIATGEKSCSAYGKIVISKYGVKKGYALLKRRFSDCKFCNEKLNKNKIERRKKHSSKEAGFGDCGGCDLPVGDGGCCGSFDSLDLNCPDCDFHLWRLTDSCDFFSSATDDVEIDLPEREKKKRQEENRKVRLEEKIEEHHQSSI